MIKRMPMSYETIVIILLSILPIVDSINGILTYANKGSIGTIYKLIIIAVMLVMVLSDGKGLSRIFGAVLVAIGYIIFSIVINGVISDASMISVDYPVKLVFNIIMFFVLMQNVMDKHISGETLYKILNYNANVIILCILVPYALNIGHAIYSGNIGYKGFYYSQNELNAALIILFFFSLYKLNQKMTLWSVFQVVGIAVCILLMSTKSSLIACALGVGVYLYEYMRKENGRKKIILIGILGIGVATVSGFVIGKIVDMFTRQNSLFSIYDGSLLATLTSGRIYTLEDAWQQLMNCEDFVINVLIGNGFFSNKLVEMDFFDIFFYLGIIGIIGVLIFLMYVLVKGKKNMKKDKNAIRVTGLIVITAFSFLTGHVLFMATSGCYFILYCIFLMTYSNEVIKSIE